MANEDQKRLFKAGVRTSRAEQGLSQRDLAEKLNVSPATVALWETGQNVPRPGMTTRLEEALDIPKGNLARLIGQVTVEPSSDVLTAIASDPRLSEKERRVLRAVYRELADV